MATERLSTREQEIVLQCMCACSEHIDDSEKHARLGLEGEELHRLIARSLDIDGDVSGSGFLAINNCLNEVCHGFPIAAGEWSTWFDGPIGEIEAVYRGWLALTGASGRVQ